MAELTVPRDADLPTWLRRAIDLADDPHDVIWHPETHGVTVPDALAERIAAPDAEPEPEGPEVPLDYEALNKTQLEDILRERGLPVSGNKPELIVRLQEDDAARADAAAAEDDDLDDPDADPDGPPDGEGGAPDA